MNDIKDKAKALKEKIQHLRKEIESGDDPLPIQMGFPKLLLEIEETLISEDMNLKKLDQFAFGIFRLVTESYEFEKSILGIRVLEIRAEIRNSSQT